MLEVGARQQPLPGRWTQRLDERFRELMDQSLVQIAVAHQQRVYSQRVDAARHSGVRPSWDGRHLEKRIPPPEGLYLRAFDRHERGPSLQGNPHGI